MSRSIAAGGIGRRVALCDKPLRIVRLVGRTTSAQLMNCVWCSRSLTGGAAGTAVSATTDVGYRLKGRTTFSDVIQMLSYSSCRASGSALSPLVKTREQRR